MKPTRFPGLPPRWLIQGRIDVRTVAEGVERIRMSTRVTRLSGMQACCYRIGRMLIDTGLSHLEGLVVRALEGRPLSFIACTHHHEDHTGNAAVLSTLHGCPVYMHNAHLWDTEGIVDMLPYRRWFWGPVAPYEPVELPGKLSCDGRTLRGVSIPGHSGTHVAYHDDDAGIVLTGDLYVSGGATAVMSHENPYDSIRSLRRVADLEPRLMLTGHGLAIEHPATLLRHKADRIEEASARVIELHARGVGEEGIVRRIFGSGRGKDVFMRILTQGEFSRTSFVRACIRHAP